ncbi:hypothetical protein TRAPUB_6894 [Trametes pubescens]|uniref:Uncharacterized protein n=1 Tax=Trametes pubescens TaxID=154538 RepID=A0A1M2V4Q1_TRAPU|nr:hypothetical protein TRAPUB_6894 [Trametes pubescens]
MAVLSLSWWSPTVIFCGLKDGTIAKLTIDSDNNSVLLETGAINTRLNILHLKFKLNVLLREPTQSYSYGIKVREGDFTHPENTLDPPAEQGDSEILITGLLWLDSSLESRKASLIASYMYHGVVIFETETWTTVHRFRESASLTASISVDPTGTFIAASNLVSGVDIHRIETGALVSSVAHDIGEEYPIPVLYIHGGYAIIGGSTLGYAYIWVVKTELPQKQQILKVPGGLKVLSVAAHYDEDTDEFSIATGLADDDHPSVVIWTAREPKATAAAEAAAEAAAVEASDDDETSSSYDKSASFCGVFGLLLLSLLVIAAAYHFAPPRSV